MSDHASMQSISPGTSGKSKAFTTDKLTGSDESPNEALQPFAQHLSNAKEKPTGQRASSPLNDDRTADGVDASSPDSGTESVSGDERVNSTADSTQTTTETTTETTAETTAGKTEGRHGVDAQPDRGNVPAVLERAGVDPSNQALTLPNGVAELVEADSSEISETLGEQPPEPVTSTNPVETDLESISTIPAMASDSSSLVESGISVLKSEGNAELASELAQTEVPVVTGNPRGADTVDTSAAGADDQVRVPATTPSSLALQAQPVVPGVSASTTGETMIRAGSTAAHPVLATDLARRSGLSAAPSLTSSSLQNATAAESDPDLGRTIQAPVPVMVNDGTEQKAELPEILALKGGQANATSRALNSTSLAMASVDGQATSTSQPVESGAANLPTNMFHAVGGGTLTAALAARMDAGAAPQLAPHVVHLQMGHIDGSLSENIRWVVDNNLRNVTVNVTPSGMGPVSINVVMENEQMNVSIVANQGTTREALEAALPRLRDQLVQQGNEQVRVDVSDGRSGQSGQFGEQTHREGEHAQSGSTDGGPAAESLDQNANHEGRALTRGLVDAYA